MNHAHRPPPRRATMLGSLVRMLLEGMADHGVDAYQLAREVGIDTEALTRESRRIPLAQATALWRRAVAVTGDPALGLKAARRVQPASAHAVGLAWFASCTLRDALRRMARFHRVLNAGLSMHLVERSTHVELDIGELAAGTVAQEAYDGLFAVTVRFCRIVKGEAYAPIAVELERPDPGCPEEYLKALGAIPSFRAARNVLVFDAAGLDDRLPAGDRDLANQLDTIAEKALTGIDRPSLADAVQGHIETLLPSGRPTLEMVARLARRSTRSLQRALQAEGTSFKDLVEAGQRDLAMRYIRETDHPLSAIALAVGFSDQSNFNRAFRRWTGRSPGAWRANAVDTV